VIMDAPSGASAIKSEEAKIAPEEKPLVVEARSEDIPPKPAEGSVEEDDEAHAPLKPFGGRTPDDPGIDDSDDDETPPAAKKRLFF